MEEENIRRLGSDEARGTNQEGRHGRYLITRAADEDLERLGGGGGGSGEAAVALRRRRRLRHDER